MANARLAEEIEKCLDEGLEPTNYFRIFSFVEVIMGGVVKIDF